MSKSVYTKAPVCVDCRRRCINYKRDGTCKCLVKEYRNCSFYKTKYDYGSDFVKLAPSLRAYQLYKELNKEIRENDLQYKIILKVK